MPGRETADDCGKLSGRQRCDFLPRRTMLLALGAGLASLGLSATVTAATSQVPQSAHDFGFVSIEGHPLHLSDFAGKAVLLVNTASRCGFTYQYEALQGLWEHYRDRGLVVLAVPSNDFGAQEPGSSGTIKAFCETTFGIDFPMTEKQRVRGSDAHPLYQWIATRLSQEAAPRWNFHKFLIDSKGQVVAGWPSRVEPQSPELVAAIEAALPQ